MDFVGKMMNFVLKMAILMETSRRLLNFTAIGSNNAIYIRSIFSSLRRFS